MPVTQQGATPVDDALAQTLPLTYTERRWRFLDVLSVESGLAIATWAFLFGGTTAQYVGFRDGVLTMLAGNTIGVVILLLALVLPSAKWGTEFFVHQRSVYGPVGALGFVLVVVVALVFAWAAILATMIGKSAVEIVRIARRATERTTGRSREWLRTGGGVRVAERVDRHADEPAEKAHTDPMSRFRLEIRVATDSLRTHPSCTRVGR